MNVSRRRKIGVIFAIIHISVFLWFLSYSSGLSGHDGQTQLLWAYWIIVDFPVSLLVFLLFAFDVTSHYVMYIVHGVLGAIWWFYLPAVFCKVAEGLSALKRRMR